MDNFYKHMLYERSRHKTEMFKNKATFICGTICQNGGYLGEKGKDSN